MITKVNLATTVTMLTNVTRVIREQWKLW